MEIHRKNLYKIDFMRYKPRQKYTLLKVVTVSVTPLHMGEHFVHAYSFSITKQRPRRKSRRGHVFSEDNIKKFEAD